MPCRTIVVTGGGNGIGRELVLALLGKGAKVAAVDLSEQGLAETVQLAGSAADRLSTHMVGSDAALMGRLVRLSPRRAADIIQKQMASLLDG